MVRKLKALLAPKFWRVPRKQQKWVVSPSPGPHKKFECIPLSILIRNVLGLAETLKESKKIIKAGNIKVDGKIRKDYRYPVGLFDTIEIEKIEKFYRIVPFKNGLKPIEISKDEVNKKICKVINKTAIKGSKIQFNLHDGKNIIFENRVKTNDVFLLELPKLKVLDVIKFEKGNLAMVIKGKLAGNIYKIKEITNSHVILNVEGRDQYVDKKGIFVVGREKPVLKLC